MANSIPEEMILEQYLLSKGIDIYSKTRKEPLMFYKHIYCYISYWHLGMSCTKIGKKLGVHHSTVTHRIKKATMLIETDILHSAFYKDTIKHFGIQFWQNKEGATRRLGGHSEGANRKKMPAKFIKRDLIKFR